MEDKKSKKVILLFSRKTKDSSIASIDKEEAIQGKPDVPPIFTKDVIDFMDGETHIPLVVSATYRDAEHGFCVSLQRTPGMFVLPEMQVGQKVSFYSSPHNGRPAICSGVVLFSSRIKADIEKISFEKVTENREEFRLFLNIPVTLMPKDDFDKKNQIEAAMVNISAGGMAFQAKENLAVDSIYKATFRLHLKTEQASYLGQIIWMKPLSSGKKLYGMIFPMLDEQQKSSLTSEIFKAQRNLRRY